MQLNFTEREQKLSKRIQQDQFKCSVLNATRTDLRRYFANENQYFFSVLVDPHIRATKIEGKKLKEKRKKGR